MEKESLWPRALTQPAPEVIDVLFKALPCVMAGVLGMCEVSRQYFQRLHKAAHGQFAALTRNLVLVYVIKAALHLQGQHFTLLHTKRPQRRGNLVDCPHTVQ